MLLNASPRGSVRLLSKCLVPPWVVSSLGDCCDPILAFGHHLSILSGGGEVVLQGCKEVVNDGDTPRPPQQLPANAHERITELKFQVSDFRVKYTDHSTVCNESSKDF